MIKQPPRKGYGYGVIRLSHKLTEHIAPLASIRLTDVQGDLQDRGAFDQFHKGLHLPDDYVIHGIYIEPYRRTWCVLVEAPGVPTPGEGEILPVLIPWYSVPQPGGKMELLRIEIADDPYHVLRVD